MNLSKIKQILLVSLFGLIVAFILLEGGLRILGALYTWRTSPREKVEIVSNKDHISILCIGASWTAGVGAPAGRGYPEQLEEILEENHPEKSFTVYRRAVVSQNTAQVLARLPDEIEQTEPDIVMILVGVANSWNHWGFMSFQGKSSGASDVSDGLERVRTYKLGKILASDIADVSRQRRYQAQRDREERNIFAGAMNKNAKGMRFLFMKNIAKAEKLFREGIEAEPDNASNYTGMGLVCLNKGAFPEAVNWLKKAIEKDPSKALNYGQIGFAYFRQSLYEEAIEWFERSLEVDPSGVWYGGYLTLAIAYEKNGQLLKAAEARKHAKKQRDVHLLAQSRIPDFKAEDIRNWIKEDFKEMVEVCRSEGIEVIMQTFPNNAYDKYDLGINRAIREAASDLGVPFVDHELLFEEYFIEKAEDRNSYFEFPGNDGYQTGEGHCNAAGYHLMAENIYKKIIDEDLIKKP